MVNTSFFVNDFSREVFNRKYSGEHKDDPEGFYNNLAELLSMGDAKLKERIFAIMTDRQFSAGGRILAFGGRPSASVSLMNCTTHQVSDDSLPAISDTMQTIMSASSHGQGIGVDLSKLRPRGAAVNNAARSSTGAISFMELFNAVGETIGQEGRRAAMLFSLSVDHPDLYRAGEQDVKCPSCDGHGCIRCKGTGWIPYDFLTVKTIPGRVESANISILVTDKFMTAVENDEMWTMRFNGVSGGENFCVERSVPARGLFTEIARSAWRSAEPGVLFIDTIRRMSNSDLFGDRWAVKGCNACSEMMLDQDGICNLGSLNAGMFVKYPYTTKAEFDFKLFEEVIAVVVELLDNVVSIELNENRSISVAQFESNLWLRRVGIGVMGLADALVKLRLHYDTSEETVYFLNKFFATLRDYAYYTSTVLAEKKGPCKVWQNASTEERMKLVNQGFYATLPDWIKQRIIKSGLRNTTLLSLAPTGSISNLLGASSGIEPIFALEYTRMTRLNGTEQFIQYVHPGVAETRALGISDEAWDTAHDVDPAVHVAVQAIAQQYIDSSIAKTTNLPEDATISDIADIYMAAWKNGLKGITVYRDNSRSSQVLYTNEQIEKKESEVCPNCGGELISHGGCRECPSCGYGRCG